MISFLSLQLIAILAAFGCSCYMFSQVEIVEYSNRYDFLIEGNIDLYIPKHISLKVNILFCIDHGQRLMGQ